MAAGTLPWQLGHRPSLDAIRGIAILSVLFGHFGLPGWSSGGTVGVALFFALSGYLITGILLAGIDFRRFYVRRARRLLPALAVLLLAIGIWSIATGRLEAFLVDAAAVSLYVTNWAWIAGRPLEGVAHAWSLAVEEQFYLAWPVALWLLLRRGIDVAIAGTVVAIALSYLATLTTLGSLHAFAGSDTRAKDLLLGCLIALIAVRTGRDVRIPTPAVVVAVAALLLIGTGTAVAIDPLLTGLPCVVLVAWAAARPNWGNYKPLTWTGRISYGLYLYHFPFESGVWPVFDNLSLWPRMLGLFLVSYLAAAASWFSWERRWLISIPGRPWPTSRTCRSSPQRG